ncbi:hypothetical protein ACFYXW_09370 [Streptomyces sp. NPDC001981]|uniref:hypothetical protein n=1 Tax=Streptomyces sp. NPDC001981 TaxID=3364628 RepID=UPI0036C9830B
MSSPSASSACPGTHDTRPGKQPGPARDAMLPQARGVAGAARSARQAAADYAAQREQFGKLNNVREALEICRTALTGHAAFRRPDPAVII